MNKKKKDTNLDKIYKIHNIILLSALSILAIINGIIIFLYIRNL